jgi:hypothetical protein
MYKQSQGYSSSLLDYDLKRRQQAIENQLAQQRIALDWQRGHDARGKSSGGVAGGIAKGVLGAGLMMTGVGAPAGAGLISSGIASAMGGMMGSGGGSGVAGINQNPGLMGMIEGAPMGGFGDWMDTGGGLEGFGGSFAEGGTINEPVIGQGLQSGQPYTFGEQGPEEVTPVGDKGEQEQPDIVKSIWDMFSSEESPFKVDNKSQAMKAMDTKGGKEKNNGGAKSITAMSKAVGGVMKMISAHYSGDTGMAKTGIKELVGAISDAALG